MHNFEQLAGNWQICNNLVGSSETKRSPHDLFSEYVLVREIKGSGSLTNLRINNLSYTNTHSYSTSASSSPFPSPSLSPTWKLRNREGVRGGVTHMRVVILTIIILAKQALYYLGLGLCRDLDFIQH